MRELLDDLMTALTDLLQCGFASCPPETGERFQRLGERCENTGLHTGGEGMKEIGELLEGQRHAQEKDMEPLTRAVCRMVRYVGLCREKMSLDLVEENWKKEERRKAEKQNENWGESHSTGD